MIKYSNKAFVFTVSLGALLSLTACTNMVSKGVNDQGVAETVIFPEIKKSWLPTGIFANPTNVRNIAPDVTKDDLYYLLGRPHFSEMHGAREWDYILKFRQGKNIQTCQYKVIFDTNMTGQSFHWLPENCAKNFSHTLSSLSADTLFPFNRGRMTDIGPEGKYQLRQVANNIIKNHSNAKVEVRGYTDYLGDENYNQQLSKARAESVKRYLVKQGVTERYISTVGKGESDPVVTCEDKGSRQALINCLAPNRHVTVTVMPH